MSNVSTPSPHDVPTPRSLKRAAVIAVILAIVLVVVVILPAERGIDLTGLGRVIGLTEMGEFKVANDSEFNAAAKLREKRKADSLALKRRER